MQADRDVDGKRAEGEEQQGVVVPRRRRRDVVEDDGGGTPWKRRVLVIGLATATAAIGAIVLNGVGRGAAYSKPVDEGLTDTRFATGRAVNAEGYRSEERRVGKV